MRRGRDEKRVLLFCLTKWVSRRRRVLLLVLLLSQSGIERILFGINRETERIERGQELVHKLNEGKLSLYRDVERLRSFK